MLIEEVKAKSYQALLMLQRMKSQCDDIAADMSFTDENEYAHIEINYEKLKGKVNYKVVPLLQSISSQVEVIATAYHKIMEVIKDEMAYSQGWQVQRKSNPSNHQEQQPDSSASAAQKGQDTDN